MADDTITRWIAWPLGAAAFGGLLAAAVLGWPSDFGGRPEITQRAFERGERAGVSAADIKAILDECNWKEIGEIGLERFTYVNEFQECLRPYGLYP